MPGSSGNGRYAAIIRELDIPVPFDLAEFTARLERQRNQPILLRPFAFTPGMFSGFWTSTAEADYIDYEQSATPFHATAIVLHEISHILLGHSGPVAWQDFARVVAPGVHPTLVRFFLGLGRSAYDTAEEREAETLASLILERATA